MPIPLPVIPNTYRCALEWVQGVTGQTAVNVIHITTNAAGVPSADVFEVLDDLVTADMWASVVNSAQILTVNITPLDGVSATSTFPVGLVARWAGETAGDFLPSSAAVVKFQTLHRGRDNRGRVFLPFTGEAAVTDGFITGGTTLTMSTAWTAFATALQGDATTPCTLVVASYDRRHAGAGAHVTAVNSIVAEAALGTQRRRQSRLR